MFAAVCGLSREVSVGLVRYNVFSDAQNISGWPMYNVFRKRRSPIGFIEIIQSY